MQQGIDKGLQFIRDTILYGIQARFGGLPENVAEFLAQIDDQERLKAISHALFTAASLDDILPLIR
jgi:hypothetical protein